MPDIHKVAAMSCQKERKRLYLLKEGLLDKSVSRKSSTHSKKPIGRFKMLYKRFMALADREHTDTHTQSKYYNPPAHARRALRIICGSTL